MVLVAAVVAAYQPVWSAGFVWDDDAYVTQNLPLRSWAGLWQIWFVPGATEQYYPLTNTSFWLEYRLWKLAPLGYHLDNVALHALNGVLLGMILRALRVPGAWLGAAIFALHPVSVESVAWVTERKNTLSGFFYLSSVLAALEFWRLAPASARELIPPRSWPVFGLSLVLYLCALLSKSATAPLPVVLLLLLWWKRGRVTGRDLVPLLGFFALGLAMSAVTLWVEQHSVGTHGATWDLSWTARAQLVGMNWWFYLGKLLWPYPLIFIYPRWEIDPAQLMDWLPLVAMVTVYGALIYFRNGILKPLLVALVYFLVLLIPVLGFFMLYFFRYSFVEDHLQYLASMGPLALAGAVLTWLGERTKKAAPWFGPLFCAVLLAGLGILSWRQSGIYLDEETLFRATLERNPGSWMAHDSLGIALMNEGRLDAAGADFEKAVQLHSDEETHGNLGLLLLQEGNVDAAIAELRKALEFAPDFAQGHNNLGSALYRKGEVDEAIAEHEKALALLPYFANAHGDLGLDFLSGGRMEEAISEFRKAVALTPDSAQAHYNLGLGLGRRGQNDEALLELKRAVEINPGYVEAYNNLGVVSFSEGHVAEAIGYLQKALELNPGYEDAQRNLAKVKAIEDRQGRGQK